MFYFKVAVVLAMLAAALAVPGYEHDNYHAHPKYEFKYGVKDPHTHDIKEQAEKRDGDKVEGYYKLVEADGTTRTVHYTADKYNGFNAHVEKSGHSTHSVAVPTYSHGASHGYHFGHGSGF